MELLYTIFVLPIEFIYGFIYFLCVKLTNNYGIGLFILSCISAVAFLPISKLAESQQNTENEDRFILAPQLALIKEKYSGKEKNDAINRLYNRYSYHPIKSIRSAFGVLLQLPFLAGAYYMISSLEDIKGQSFLCISDLSQPDGLLFGFNLLPILMTLINIGVIFTTKGLQKKDILQALTIAACFLVLLYNAPSALLIFWTMNNILFLSKNISNEILPLSKTRKSKTTCFTYFFPVSSPSEIKIHSKIYFYSLFSLTFIIFFYLPINLYVSDISFFNVALSELLMELLPIAFGAVFIVSFLWLVVSNVQARMLMSFFSLFGFCFVFVNMFIIVRDFGVLDHGILSKSGELLEQTFYFRDFFVSIIVACTLTIIFSIKKIITYTPKLLSILTIPFICISFYNALFKSSITNDFIVKSEEKVFAEIQSYSKDKENVVIFFLDMFTGGHIEKMIDDPWFENFTADLDGFTWYPDTTSPGECTIVGSSTIYGGPDYTPLKINAMNTPIMEVYNKAMAVLPRNFSNNGYITHLVEIFKPFNKKILQKHGALNEKSFYIENLNYQSLNNNPFQLKLKKEKSAYFPLSVALYTISPSLIKKKIYQRAWLDTLEALPLRAGKEVAQLYSFFNIGINNKSPNPTFKIFYSKLPHHPWTLDKDTMSLSSDPYPETEGIVTLVDDIIPEHYYTERHIMKMLMDYIEILKQNNIYNNTKIILVSDHCDGDSQMLGKLFPNRPRIAKYGSKDHIAYQLGRPHALLLVKDFNQHGPMVINHAYMCNSDVPMIAASHLNTFDAFEAYNPYQRTNDDVRIHSLVQSWRLEDQEENNFIFARTWEIKGSMFELNNWKEMKK